MSAFIHENFHLDNKFAQELYHDFAAGMPIIDYHCHLPPAEIAKDHRYADLAELWLGGDHYKWRAMRTNGIDERFCTGEASPREKFDQWAKTVPSLLRNPLYHWTHLELKRYFDMDCLLSPATADEVWERCNAQIQNPDFSARQLMLRSKVHIVCTTDDPIDSLEYHQAIAADSAFTVKVLPTWRPDKAMAVENVEVYNAYIDRLSAVSGINIGDNYDDLMLALKSRHDFFHAQGCRLSDHGLETLYADAYTVAELKAIFKTVRSGKELGLKQIQQFKSALLHEFGLMDHARSWVQQFHIGAMRNNNQRLYQKLGPDTGFDSIGDYEIGRPLSRFLSNLDKDARLTKTILYNLNPRDNELYATMIGNFQDGTFPGKIQYGSGWWFLDQKDGMERQMNALSQLGLLSRFVGMLTDSRSFLSYTRHEYFRRILCNLLGNEMQRGLIPQDMSLVGNMVKDICYNNAARYFDFGLKPIV